MSTPYLLMESNHINLKYGKSLNELNSFINEIEKYLDIKFCRTITDSYFSKGIKNKKAIQKYLDE